MIGAILSLAIINFCMISINQVPVEAANVSTSILQSLSALTNLAGFYDCNCFSRSYCAIHEGEAGESCGGGYVCCKFVKKCGTKATANQTYFTHPTFPYPYNGGDRCSITIPKLNSNICQLRLDLLDFSLVQPTSEGKCDSDSLLITGSATEIPRICGENSGQHIYVNYQDYSPINLYVHTNPSGIFQSRRWTIQISQIECNSASKAPSGCLQYYTSVSGTVTSFNYGTMNNPRLGTGNAIGTREMANLNYGVCIRVEENYCSLRWSAAEEDSFTVSGNAATSAVASGASCKTDYVIIPDPSEANVKTNVDRYCGTKFTSKITSLKPYTLYVVTDDTETSATTPDLSNRGFSLNYRQLLCSI